MNFSVIAQDIITLKNGDDIQALVQEIGEVDIKYKKFDNPNGPNYMLKKSEIFMIRYQNGTKDVFKAENQEKEDSKPEVSTTPERISKEEIFISEKNLVYGGWWDRNFYLDEKKLSKKETENLFYGTNSLLLYKKGRQFQGLGVATGIMGSVVLGMSVIIIGNEGLNTSNGSMFFAGSVCYANALVYIGRGQKYKHQAAELYNKNSYRKKNDLSLNVGITQSGGIGLTFNF